MITPIPVTVWRDSGGVWTARITRPPGPRCTVWIEGWDTTTAETATAGPDATPFIALVHSALCVLGPGADSDITLRASGAPGAGVAIGHGGPARASITLAAGWPRGMIAPGRPATRAVAPPPALVARLLDAGDIETLLALLGESLLAGADRAGIEAACHQLLHHLVHHPLRRDPALGALVAALSA